jgi:hypothetical protein
METKSLTAYSVNSFRGSTMLLKANTLPVIGVSFIQTINANSFIIEQKASNNSNKSWIFLRFVVLNCAEYFLIVDNTTAVIGCFRAVPVSEANGKNRDKKSRRPEVNN